MKSKIKKLETYEILGAIREREHLRMYKFDSVLGYELTNEGIKFIEDGKSYVAEYKAERKTKWWKDLLTRAENFNKVLTPILGVFTLLLTVASVYFASQSIQQNKDIEQLNKDRDELKARVEILEKDKIQRDIESKLKLPIRK